MVDTRYAPSTIDSYSYQISKVDLSNVMEDLRRHKETEPADKSFNLRITALKNYAKFLKKSDPGNELITILPDLNGVKNVISEPHMPYSVEQMKKILGAAKGWRKQAILIAAYAGLRQAELQHLNIQDINFDKKILSVRDGKGHKSRKVPIPSTLMDELLLWKERRKRARTKKPIGDNWLFSNRGTAPVMSSGKILDSLSKKVGIVLIWHSFRATYAKHVYVNSNNDIRLVQKLLGHSSIKTTQDYITFFDEEIQAKVDGLGELYG